MKISRRSFDEFNTPELQFGWEGKVLFALLVLIPMPSMRSVICFQCRKVFKSALVIHWLFWIFVFWSSGRSTRAKLCRANTAGSRRRRSAARLPSDSVVFRLTIINNVVRCSLYGHQQEARSTALEGHSKSRGRHPRQRAGTCRVARRCRQGQPLNGGSWAPDHFR